VSGPGLRKEVPSSSPWMIGRGRAPSAGETILVVEDEDFVREVTCEVLEFEGYRVLKARSAAEATRLFHLAGDAVELLLTDIVLPGPNGCRLARELMTLCPTLKILFISGYPENEAARQGLPEDGTSYLSKPFSVEALTRMVRQVLDEDKRRAPGNGRNQEAKGNLLPAALDGMK
jgi:two-component system, cell cycle sensor histidine kinase and response regulator CckA